MFTIIFVLVGLNVDSKIDSVVVYSDRVMVTRNVDLYLDGTVDLVFADLPGSLDDQSIKVKAPGLIIGEVQIHKGYTAKSNPRLKEIDDKIKVFVQKDRALSDELLVMKDKEKFLQSIAVGVTDVISKEVYTGKVSPLAWEQGLRFMVDGLLSVKKRIAEIEQAKLELTTELDTLKRKLNDTKALASNRKTLRFDVHPEKPKNYRIELSYILSGASWSTYYEIRTNPSTGKIGITYFGKIYQRTGEDWENVKVVLSTGKLALGGAVPEPTPLYIYSYSYQTERAKQMVPRPIAMEAIAEAKKITAQTPSAAPVETGIAILYPLLGRFSVKSGESEKKVQIYETLFNANFEYLIIPRLTNLAYSTGIFQNKSDYLFLAGEAGTYVGDDFTGKTFLLNIAPDESTTVSLGVDERIKIQRELKKSRISKGGLFKKTKRHDLVYSNSIKNFHTKDIECTIIDQVPVSQSAEIKVSDIKFEPKPTEEDKNLGIYYFRTKIKPSAEFKI